MPQRHFEAAGTELAAERIGIDVGIARRPLELADELRMYGGRLSRPAAVVGREGVKAGEVLVAQGFRRFVEHDELELEGGLDLEPALGRLLDLRPQHLPRHDAPCGPV